MAALSTRTLASLSLALVLATVGCKTDEQQSTPVHGGGVAGPEDAGAPQSGPCPEGATRDCHVTVAKNAGIITCLVGTETCSGGKWGPCEGSISSQPAGPQPPGGDAQGSQQTGEQVGELATPMSLSDAGPCQNNPCDPTCKIFNEDGGVTPPKGDGGTFQAGSVTSIPSGFVGKGVKEGCATGIDCQFDMYCSNPTSGTCAHKKCSTGAPLALGCDGCVDSICATDASCCQATSGTCSHPKCSTGAAMVKGCDSCVDSVCAADSSCCEISNGTCSHAKCSTGAAMVKGCDSCVDSVCAADASCCEISNGTCSHAKCTSGSPLTSGCDPCVTSICAASPSCCTPTFKAACSTNPGHDPCVVGKKLTAACDPCVQAICAAKPSCCSGSGNAWDASCVAAVATTAACGGKTCTPIWSNACVAKVATTCGQSCTPTWSASCVAKVGSVCGQSCSPTWSASCIAKVGTVCGQSCSGTWSQSCVDKVDTVCGAICGGGTAGDCKQWGSGTIDPKCTKADLTAGIPCTGKVPICNRGTVTAPAGVKVYVYPGNSSHFPKCNPPAGAETAQCTVPVAIPPGECVDITEANCVGGNVLTGNKTVMVNPPFGAIAECHCENNWSDYHNGGCQTSSSATYTSVVYQQIYKATCDPGKHVQWGFLTFDSTTPADSKITFQAHTADTQAKLGAALTDLAVAKATPAPDTQVCPLANGPAGCPINLFTKLGAGPAQQTVLELVITLDPSSDELSAPTLKTWKLTYSCPDSE